MRIEEDFTWREVGNRVREWRLAAGMSQSRLAEQTGLTQAGIAAVESGEHDPRLTTLKSIAQALGRSTRELICGDRPDPTPAVARIRVRRLGAATHRLT